MKDAEIECLKAEVVWVKETLAVSIQLNKKLQKENNELRKRVKTLLADKSVESNNIWLYCLVFGIFTALAIYGIIKL